MAAGLNTAFGKTMSAQGCKLWRRAVLCLVLSGAFLVQSTCLSQTVKTTAEDVQMADNTLLPLLSSRLPQASFTAAPVQEAAQILEKSLNNSQRHWLEHDDLKDKAVVVSVEASVAGRPFTFGQKQVSYLDVLQAMAHACHLHIRVAGHRIEIKAGGS